MEVLKLLNNNTDYAYLLISETINLIGAVFTSVLIYYLLDKLDAPAWYFTFAYFAIVVPQYFGSLLAEKLGARFTLFTATMFANIFCLFALAITIFGFIYKNLNLMLVSECAIYLALGILNPFLAFYQKTKFLSHQLASITVIQTINFGIHSVIGFAIGTWLVSNYDPFTIFSIDAFTYIVSSIIMIFLSRSVASGDPINIKPLFELSQPIKNFNTDQRRLFWLMPMIAIMGMPIMSLGPILIDRNHNTNLGISTVLLFLLARTFGQFIGPIITNFIDLERLSNFRPLLPVCSFIFFSCYYLISNSKHICIILLLVIIAHLFSNISSMTAYYALLKNFDNIETVSAKQNQYNTIFGLISALFATFLLTGSGIHYFFVYIAIIWFAICIIYLKE